MCFAGQLPVRLYVTCLPQDILIQAEDPHHMKLKGSVQRKLRWVETGVNQWVWASDRSAGQYFIVKVSLHLLLSLFPFPVSTTQFIGEFWTNKQSVTGDVAPTVLALYRMRYWRYVAPCA
jgi:hypothetical protein